MTTDTRKQIADTILRQLGGSKFITMTGAKNFSFDAKGNLAFRFLKPRGKKVNYCKISLDSTDTYNVQFGYIRNIDFTEGDLITMVYADQLQTVFTAHTGLDTHL